MKTYSEITLTVSDLIATLSINRPKARNALNRTTINELTLAFNALSQDPDIRCIILRGSGDEAFCAGADLDDLRNNPSPEARRDLFQSIATLITSIEACKQPVIALVYGYALAGGLGLVAAADIVIAANDSVFGLPEVLVGLSALVVAAPLSKRIAPRGLSYLALTGERISAQSALDFGLVTEVTPKEAALERALGIAKKISLRGPQAVSAAKAGIDYALTHRATDTIFELADRSAIVSLGDEASEGIAAFKEKREPYWKGGKR
jgi:enoyl-CoA hydratase/carnithine racemase